MRRLNRFTALCAGVLLLAAPAAFACGDLGATMTSQCPMAEMAEMAEMAGSMGTSMCHDGGRMSEDCCDVRSAPEPMQALSVESQELLVSLDVTGFQVAASPSPATLPLHLTAVNVFHLHDRCTLFSSLLL